jgi:ParB family chromosome partitioning protein
VHAVRPNAQQPREVFDEDEMAELVHSIREVGVLQPVVVRPHSDGSYELVMGERRWRAARAAGLDAVPAIIRVTADQDLLRDALLENLHRAQLNPLEEASAYRQLLDDFGCSQEELSSRIGRSRPQISNTLRLLRLTPAVQRRVAAGVLSAGHAKALVALDDAAAQERLATRVVAEGLSVRATEEVVSLGGDQSEARPRRRRAARRPAPEVEERLAEQLDTRVRIEAGRSRGRIVIEFATDEDLGRIVDLIDPPRTADASEWTHSSDLSN